MRISEIDISNYSTILLDRDGVINRYRPNDYVKSWDEFEFLPDVCETIANWMGKVDHIFIVTNQRGVGRGIMTETTLNVIHKKMLAVINSYGGHIDKIYYCTAISESDCRRKPGRGMFDDILKDYPDVRPQKCLMVGDSDSDMEFARNCGIDGLMID